jgi:formylglycine-generating enzyme required for sulfatase activity
MPEQMDQQELINPEIEKPSEDENADEPRICRELMGAAQAWLAAGAPRFRRLPDRATMKQYQRVRPACALGEDVELVRRFLSVAQTRQRMFEGLLSLFVIVLSIWGTDSWLRNREMNWNVLRIWTLAQVGMYDGPPMVVIPAGPFEMGDSDCTAGDKRSSCPPHSVAMRSFRMAKYEVTFDEYSAFVLERDDIKLPPPYEGWDRGSRPVIKVSWEDARAYAEWLNKIVARNKTFRLPTEAEWEYACRAGSRTRFYTGETETHLHQAGWYATHAGDQTHPVGAKAPNAFGLYDMHGNVWEWVEDDWHTSYTGAPNDGSAWIDTPRGPGRVVRGGAWSSKAWTCRSAMRFKDQPAYRALDVGFRLSRSVAPGH